VSQTDADKEPPSAVEVAVVRDRSGVRLSVGDRVVAIGTDMVTLVAAAHELGESDPLKLAAGASLRLELMRPDAAALLTSIRHKDTDVLWERRADMYDSEWDIPAVDIGNSVNGLPWGWFLLDQGGDQWQLIPVGPSEAILDAVVGFDGAGMVGGSIDIGILRWGDLAAISWRDAEGSSPSMSLSYEIDDWNTLFLEAFAGFLDGISICPACEESEDWGVRIDADPMFAESLIGQAMSEIYVPCDMHRGETADLVVHDVAGLDWRWTGSTWASVTNS
jgi:hypothetical protein